MLVKRLVCIEDLGDVDVLFTDKTGTLTDGRIDYMRAVPADAAMPERVLRWGLLCTEDTATAGVGGNPLDQALWRSPAAAGQQPALAGPHRARACCPSTTSGAWSPSSCATRPDHDAGHQGRAGDACWSAASTCRDARHAALAAEFAAGNRVVAVATRPVAGAHADRRPTSATCTLAGLLVFLDPPKHGRGAPRCARLAASASRSRSSPATTPRSPPRSATTSASPTAAR